MSEKNRQSMNATWPAAEPGPEYSTVRRLRARGCWTEAAALLAGAAAQQIPSAALERAALLIERSLFTLSGWEEAEEAMAHAEAIAGEDKEAIGAAACESAFLAYTRTFLNGQDQAAAADAAMAKADSCLSELSPAWPLLEFRRGLIAENLGGDLSAARAAYERAHAAAEANGDALLLS